MTHELWKWWPLLWLLAGVLVVAAFNARHWLKRMMRLAKAAATDKRLPPSVRWLFKIGLLAKLMPIDFGIDEVCLGLGVLLLATLHRETWAQIRSEIQ